MSTSCYSCDQLRNFMLLWTKLNLGNQHAAKVRMQPIFWLHCATKWLHYGANFAANVLHGAVNVQQPKVQPCSRLCSHSPFVQKDSGCIRLHIGCTFLPDMKNFVWLHYLAAHRLGDKRTSTTFSRVVLCFTMFTAVSPCPLPFLTFPLNVSHCQFPVREGATPVSRHHSVRLEPDR